MYHCEAPDPLDAVEAGEGARDFFAEASPYLSHRLLTVDRSIRELDQVESLVGPITGEVLDIGCGFGRHAVVLALRGAVVTAVDPSTAMIAAARARADEADVSINFVCTKGSKFVAVARYDLALCLFTTLGQLDTNDERDHDDAGHLTLLQRAKAALRPGAKIVIEVPDKQRAVAALIAEEQLGSTAVIRKFDAETSVITERFRVGSGEEFLLRYRVFDKTELVGLTHQAGFNVLQSLDRGLVEPPMTMMTLVAQRSG